MIIEYSNELYPDILRDIKNPPSRLYALGNVDLLKRIGIAVIGSRANSNYGEKMCKQFVKGLVEYNITIISGLANGIDSISHISCLKNSGYTIAVLPSGFNEIYPQNNQKLFFDILKNDGLVISEYEENVKADSNKFRERNRIIAGLSIGTLVIEAGYNSGTSITARNTIEQGKPVFAIPSSLENKKGIVTNELIRKGAKLITKVDDIIQEFDNIEFSKVKKMNKNFDIDMPKELLDVYKVIDTNPININEIAKKSKLSINEVNYKIMLLIIEDKIIELPGYRYIRKEEE